MGLCFKHLFQKVAIIFSIIPFTGQLWNSLCLYFLLPWISSRGEYQNISPGIYYLSIPLMPYTLMETQSKGMATAEMSWAFPVLALPLTALSSSSAKSFSPILIYSVDQPHCRPLPDMLFFNPALIIITFSLQNNSHHLSFCSGAVHCDFYFLIHIFPMNWWHSYEETVLDT